VFGNDPYGPTAFETEAIGTLGYILLRGKIPLLPYQLGMASRLSLLFYKGVRGQSKKRLLTLDLTEIALVMTFN